MEERRIDTKLTGKKNYQILHSILGQLSDGMWQNSTRMIPYWNFATVEIEGDRVMIVIDKTPAKGVKDYSHPSRSRVTGKLIYKMKDMYNPYIDMSDDAIKHWFAQKIKIIFKEEYGNAFGKENWRRDNQEQVSFFGYDEPITVSDLYFAYDTLMNRSTSNKIYSKVNQTFESIMRNFNPKNIIN